MSQQRRRLPRLFPAELFLVTAGSRAGLLALLTDLEAYLGRPLAPRDESLIRRIERKTRAIARHSRKHRL